MYGSAIAVFYYFFSKKTINYCTFQKYVITLHSQNGNNASIEIRHPLKQKIALWCNGSTSDSGSACGGSNPSKATKKSQLIKFNQLRFLLCRIFHKRSRNRHSKFGLRLRLLTVLVNYSGSRTLRMEECKWGLEARIEWFLLLRIDSIMTPASFAISCPADTSHRFRLSSQ